jgi:lipopolysaccharide transport system ATP-binding protein
LPTSSDLAVEIRGVGKSYQLGQLKDIRHRLLHWVQNRAMGGHLYDTQFFALEDVSFDIARGECIGILGENGSGKSTLVQIISGISVPTAGEIVVRGRVLPLLEVGAGFHPELTARENVFLFGTIIGIPRKEIAEALPDMFRFAELDWDHVDTPLKRYSMGMRARLSFAVAMRFPADIYVFDEVMAVVDDHFRGIAVREIQELVARGKTVIFISHDLDLVRTLCTRGVWLDRGHMRELGPIERIADLYSAAELEGLSAEEAEAAQV